MLLRIYQPDQANLLRKTPGPVADDVWFCIFVVTCWRRWIRFIAPMISLDKALITN